MKKGSRSGRVWGLDLKNREIFILKQVVFYQDITRIEWLFFTDFVEYIRIFKICE